MTELNEACLQLAGKYFVLNYYANKIYKPSSKALALRLIKESELALIDRKKGNLFKYGYSNKDYEEIIRISKTIN